MKTTFADPAALTSEAVEHGAVFAPRFDAAGLITAVAVAHDDGAVVMVAYMNAEALAKTIATGQVHYYSRSRKSVWLKGETSGEIQKLVEIRTDCDQDALVVVVELMGRGAACHTGQRSCFYRRVAGTDRLEDRGEQALFDPAEVYGG